MSEAHTITVQALSNADALGYRGQQAVSEAAGDDGNFRIVGGHMVRLLLFVYPTPGATLRSTLDADAAVGSVHVVEPFAQNLLAKRFVKKRGNLFYKELEEDQRVEINLLLSREGPTQGLRTHTVPGVGQVDTLPELRFALMDAALVLDVEADLGGDEIIRYRTRIPDLEAAVVLKAHSWKERRSDKDLADLHSLLEIREAHPGTAWRLNEGRQRGFRKDASRILQDLAARVVRKNTAFTVPGYLDRFRLAGLITKHVSQEARDRG